MITNLSLPIQRFSIRRAHYFAAPLLHIVKLFAQLAVFEAHRKLSKSERIRAKTVDTFDMQPLSNTMIFSISKNFQRFDQTTQKPRNLSLKN